MIPMIPKIIAATGIDINPALLPCEFDAMATMMIDETTVAIVDFFIIPTQNPGKGDSKRLISVRVGS